MPSPPPILTGTRSESSTTVFGQGKKLSLSPDHAKSNTTSFCREAHVPFDLTAAARKQNARRKTKALWGNQETCKKTPRATFLCQQKKKKVSFICRCSHHLKSGFEQQKQSHFQAWQLTYLSRHKTDRLQGFVNGNGFFSPYFITILITDWGGSKINQPPY